jgi:hypothetical protein
MAWLKSIRLRYTLRALFVFVTLFALWGGYHTNRGWKERRAEAVLLRHSASLQYWPLESGDGFCGVLTSAYRKLVAWLWREQYIRTVELVSPLEPEIVDALAALTRPAEIAVHANSDPAPMVEAPKGAIERILKGHKLVSLHLNDFALSDEAFAAIGRHHTLEELNLRRTNLTEDAFAQLIALLHLRCIDCQRCEVTGAKLGGVPGSTTLETIRCSWMSADIELARFVARSPRVSELLVPLDGD